MTDKSKNEILEFQESLGQSNNNNNNNIEFKEGRLYGFFKKLDIF